MRTRRGTDFWPGELGQMIHQFQPGDIVSNVAADSDTFLGSVRSVDSRINKVLVAWGGGSVVQHDPDEIMIHPHMTEFLVERMSEGRSAKMAARRVRSASQVQKVEEKVQ